MGHGGSLPRPPSDSGPSRFFAQDRSVDAGHRAGSLRMTGRGTLSDAEDEGAGGGEGAAGAVDTGQAGAGDLALAALPAELADGLDEEEDAVHAGVGVGEAAAVGVEGELAAGGGAPAGHQGAPPT